MSERAEISILKRTCAKIQRDKGGFGSVVVVGASGQGETVIWDPWVSSEPLRGPRSLRSLHHLLSLTHHALLLLLPPSLNGGALRAGGWAEEAWHRILSGGGARMVNKRVGRDWKCELCWLLRFSWRPDFIAECLSKSQVCLGPDSGVGSKNFR
ncbi:hypothetical protein E2C01_030455 [Portunus trituberculatus]|uniref:Uncharacterized protein n=1 Tax=Portunus trituberculatus TaxID=210409 RepID=A0A5B7ES43_PORTR|nr:hypothetical protein [Portunus trituberculatus]